MLPQTMMIRADVVRALGGYDPRLRRHEDVDFMYRCAAAGYRIDTIREPLVRYRRQGHESLTKAHLAVFLCIYRSVVEA